MLASKFIESVGIMNPLYLKERPHATHLLLILEGVYHMLHIYLQRLKNPSSVVQICKLETQDSQQYRMSPKT